MHTRVCGGHYCRSLQQHPGSAALLAAREGISQQQLQQHRRRRACASASGGAADEVGGAAASTSGQAVHGWSLSQAGESRQPGRQHRQDVAVVLVHPQIPQNTGNIARTCAATNVPLHLVGPLGFEITDKQLKRAGLDYWPQLRVQMHESWEAFYQNFSSLQGPRQLVGFSVYGDSYYAGPDFTYEPGSWLVFGAETTGLPMQAHQDIVASGGRLVQIPIVHDLVRSLNLSVCVGVGVFEALRQLDTGRHAVAPRDDARSPMVRLPTPLMAAAAAGAGQQQLVQAEPAAAAVGARRPQGA